MSDVKCEHSYDILSLKEREPGALTSPCYKCATALEALWLTPAQVSAAKAAPEMLEALKGVIQLLHDADLVRNTHNDAEFLKFFDQGVRLANKLKAVQDAIEKAEGRE